MSSTKKFINLPELGRKVRALLIPHLSIDNFLFSLAILSSLFLAPYPLPAEEKQQVDSNQNNTTVSTTEGLLASTEQMIEQLIQQLELQNENPIEKAELTENPSPTSFFSSIPNIRPVKGSITSNFGIRLHPVYHVPLFHAGIDFSVSEGTRVQSTGDGIVAYSGYEKGYGQKVTINHGYGYKTIYAHLSKSLVRQGQKVKRGDVIALSGNTGVSTGPHMHYTNIIRLSIGGLRLRCDVPLRCKQTPMDADLARWQLGLDLRQWSCPLSENLHEKPAFSGFFIVGALHQITPDRLNPPQWTQASDSIPCHRSRSRRACADSADAGVSAPAR